MRAESLGIDPKTGWHRKNPLTIEEQAFLGVLWVDHEGKENAIPAKDLTRKWAARLGIGLADDEYFQEWMRDLREMQNHILIDHNVPAISKAGIKGGYFIAATQEEAEEFYGSFRKRGMTGLVKATRGRQSAMVDMVAQLSFEFEQLVDKTGIQTQRIVPKGGAPAPIEVVDAFLARMTRDPAKFADGLRKIGEKYGSVLLPKQRFDAMIAAIKTKTSELQDLARNLEQ